MKHILFAKAMRPTSGMRTRRLLSVALVGAVFVVGTATGQEHSASYPNRSVRIVVPAGAGGTIDVIVRSLVDTLSTGLGQPVIVENRAGAGGMIGMNMVAKSAPDGYTIGLGHVGPNAIAPLLQKAVPYDPVADFQPVSLVAEMPLILVVNKSSGITTLKEFIARAKSQSGGLTYGSQGAGSFSNVTGELFARESGAKLVHVPFKSAPESLQELLAGRLDSALSVYQDVSSNIKAGKIQALAITSAKRHPLLPDVPTVGELGFPALEAVGWMGIFLPAHTPKPIVDKIHDQVVVATNSAAFRARISNMGFLALASTPEQLAERVKADTVRWGAVIKQAGISAN